MLNGQNHCPLFRGQNHQRTLCPRRGPTERFPLGRPLISHSPSSFTPWLCLSCLWPLPAPAPPHIYLIPHPPHSPLPPSSPFSPAGRLVLCSHPPSWPRSRTALTLSPEGQAIVDVGHDIGPVISQLFAPLQKVIKGPLVAGETGRGICRTSTNTGTGAAPWVTAHFPRAAPQLREAAGPRRPQAPRG